MAGASKGQEFPLRLTIKAVDEATAKLRAINASIAKTTAPVRKLNNSLRALSAEAGLPKLMKGFGGVASAVKGVGQEVFALGRTLAGFVGAGLFGAFGVFKLAQGAVEAGDKIGELSKRVGMTADAYRQLAFAAGQNDIEQEQFAAGMDQLNRRLGELRQGVGPLKALPAAFRAQLLGAKDTEAAFGLMTDAVAKFKTTGEKAAFGALIFGKAAGPQMAQLLAEGRSEIVRLKMEAAALLGPQEEFVEQSGKMDNELKRLETAFSGLQATLGAELLPAFTELAREVTRFVSGNRGNLGKWAREAGGELLKWVKGGGLQRTVDGVRDLATNIGKLVEHLGGLKTIAAGAGVIALAPLLGSVISLASAIIGLNTALGATGLTLAGVLGPAAAVAVAIGAIGAAAYQAWKHWDDLKLAASDFGRAISDAWGGDDRELRRMTGFDDGRERAAAGQLTEYERVNGLHGSKPWLGAANVAPKPTSHEAHVTLDINGAPKGTRVTKDPNSKVPVTTNVGVNLHGGSR
jgi:hypothetical protein